MIDLPVNMGLAAARNAGMRRARGSFIGFLDDDDSWLPQKLEAQRRYIEDHPDCDVVHSAVWAFFSKKADQLWKFFGPRPLTLAEALTHDIWVIPSTLLIRTEAMRAIGGFDPVLRQNEDGDFVIRCCAAGYRIEGISEPLARLRREQHSSLTRRHVRMYFTHIRLCWKHRKLYYGVYGLRGIVTFLVASLHLATRETRYVDAAVRLLMRFIKVKWKVRAQYSEPVLSAKRADIGRQGD
jgi:glycosyltransferase involved in cell wall biosynthesis